MALLVKYWRLERKDKFLLMEAFTQLVCAKLLLALTPFRRLAEKFKKIQLQPKSSFDPSEMETASRVAWAVESVARHVPLGFVCLPQAVAAKWMLHRRGLPSTLYIGVKGAQQAVAAHAWLSAGETILTGKKGIDGHRVLAAYA